MLNRALPVIIPFILFVSGCTSVDVKPWEKGILAKPEMQFGYDEISLGLDDHIYFSKEASSGGRSFSGGGCGCN